MNNIDLNISIDKIRKSDIIKSKLDSKIESINEEMSMPTPPYKELPSLNDVVDCDSLLNEITKLKDLPYNIKVLAIEKSQEIKLLAQLIFYNTINKIVHLDEVITELWNKIVKEVLDIINEIREQFIDIFAYYKASLKKIKTTFRNYKKASTPEEKEIYKKELLQYNENILEILGISEFYFLLMDLWTMLKSIWGIAKDGWKKMINGFNSLKELLIGSNTPLINKVMNWIELLLPLLATLALSILAAVEMSKKQQKANEKTLEEGLKDIEKPDDISELSLLLKQAKNNQNIINDKEEIKIEDSSIISICPILSPNVSLPEEDFVGYAIEIGLNYPNFSFNVDVNEDIKVNDIIGYIEKTPIKSKIEGKVIEKKDRHILIKSKETEEIEEIPKEDETINSIIKAFEDISYIEDILKNDIIYTYKTILYKNSLYDENSTTNTFEIYDKIIDSFNKDSKKLEENIKNICNKDNISKLLEKEDGLLKVKDDILKLKKEYFSKIFSTLNDNNISINSNKIIDNKLIDYYYEFISNFSYDSNNKYKVELYNIITSFIQDRKIKETLKKDIVEDINKIAIEINNKIKNFFKDYIEKDIIKINLNNVDSIYEYIKKIFNIKSPQSREIKLDLDNINSDKINEVINNNEESLSKEDLDNIHKDKLIKKIALLLHIWHIYKNSSNNEKSLDEQTIYEFNILLDFYEKIHLEYINAYNIINNIDSFAEVNWSCSGTIYINNKEYKHYLFINELDIIVSEEDGNNQLSTKTKYEPSSYKYWLKYCGMATLLNCALPIYWGTGIVISGVPMSLPIILVPIHVISGKCTCVIGLGICGIMIYPMLLFSNLSANIATYIIPVNIIMDMINQTLENIKIKTTGKALKEIIEPQITVYNNLIRKTEEEIENIKKEMDILKSL